MEIKDPSHTFGMTNASHSFGMTNTSYSLGMVIRKEFGDVLFLLSFRWSVSDERSFAYAQDDKGKEFGMTFFVFVIPIMLFLFLSFR